MLLALFVHAAHAYAVMHQDEIPSHLHLPTFTKLINLQTTRLGKHVNELRRKAQDRYLASRAKNLVKKWRQLLVTPAAAAAAASGAASAAATDSSASGGGSAVSSRVTSPAAVSQG